MTHYIKRIFPQQVHAFFDKTRNWSACVRQCTIPTHLSKVSEHTHIL